MGMKEYRFRYGDGEVVIPLDEGQVLGELHGNHVPAAASIPDTPVSYTHLTLPTTHIV